MNASIAGDCRIRRSPLHCYKGFCPRPAQGSLHHSLRLEWTRRRRSLVDRNAAGLAGVSVPVERCTERGDWRHARDASLLVLGPALRRTAWLVRRMLPWPCARALRRRHEASIERTRARAHASCDQPAAGGEHVDGPRLGVRIGDERVVAGLRDDGPTLRILGQSRKIGGRRQRRNNDGVRTLVAVFRGTRTGGLLRGWGLRFGG